MNNILLKIIEELIKLAVFIS